MKTITHGRRARDPLLHIEADGVLINVRVGLTDNEGHHVTNVSISPDDRSRGGDGEGYYWYQDGARIIRLNPGEEPPVPGGRFKVGETVTFSVMHTFLNGVIEEYHERSQSYLVRAEDDGLLWFKEDQLYAGPDRPQRDVWVEPLVGPGKYGPFFDDIEASEFMDEQGLSDEGHKIVHRPND